MAIRILRAILPIVFATMAVACSSNGSRSAVPQLPTVQSVSPARIPPAPMAKTAILPAGAMAVKPQSTIQGLNWTQIGGAASYVAAAPDGSFWVLSTVPAGSDKYIWHYVNGSWTNISGLASRLSIAPDGTLYAINSGGGAYSYNGTAWTALGGGCSDITAAKDNSIYVLSNGNSIGSDQAIWHYSSGWTQVLGAGVRIAASWDPHSFTLSGGTVSANGLYILNSLGNIFYENTDNSFVPLPGSASAIAPTTIGGVFVLGYPANNNGNSIYYYNLDTPGWSAQSGAAVSISTDSAHLYAIGSTGGIYSSPVAPASGTIIEYTLPTSNGSPLGIAAGPDGNLWFTEVNASKIGKITTSGTFTEYATPTSGAYPWGIAAGPDGNLWFTEENAGKIGKITTSGAITEYALPMGAGPEGIVAGPDGNLWFADGGSDKIGKITTGGTITEYAIPTNNAIPRGITAGPGGNLWFTEVQGNKIGKITTSGTITEYTVPTNAAAPWGIVTGPDNNLWFTESAFASNKIGNITPNGSFTEFVIQTPTAEPEDITVGPDGSLWFSEYGSSKIGRLLATQGIAEYALPMGAGPEGIATGPDGNVWFTEVAGNKIGKITP
ncbi:MAG: virginiamycin B lyase family protein [Vulcanimicrobiaceae bacterium]